MVFDDLRRSRVALTLPRACFLSMVIVVRDMSIHEVGDTPTGHADKAPPTDDSSVKFAGDDHPFHRAYADAEEVGDLAQFEERRKREELGAVRLGRVGHVTP